MKLLQNFIAERSRSCPAHFGRMRTAQRRLTDAIRGANIALLPFAASFRIAAASAPLQSRGRNPAGPATVRTGRYQLKEFTMEVILREDIERLGSRGDVVKVAAGYPQISLPKRWLSRPPSPTRRLSSRSGNLTLQRNELKARRGSVKIMGEST